MHILILKLRPVIVTLKSRGALLKAPGNLIKIIIKLKIIKNNLF